VLGLPCRSLPGLVAACSATGRCHTPEVVVGPEQLAALAHKVGADVLVGQQPARHLHGHAALYTVSCGPPRPDADQIGGAQKPACGWCEEGALGVYHRPCAGWLPLRTFLPKHGSSPSMAPPQAWLRKQQ
jgi:hypothetical protein